MFMVLVTMGVLNRHPTDLIGRSDAADLLSPAGRLRTIRFQQHEISRVAGLDHAEFVQLSEKQRRIERG